MSIRLLKRAMEMLDQNSAEWKDLADSGDAGFWKAEERETYIKTNALSLEIEEYLANRKKTNV